MNILMLGWEFPPFSKGGLGTACYGLTKGLSNSDVNVTFVLPKAKSKVKDKSSHVNLILANEFCSKNFHLEIKEIDSILMPYATSQSYERTLLETLKHSPYESEDDPYGKNLTAEVERFALRVREIAKGGNYDIIHAHDWMTYKAGILAKEVLGIPLVVHIHATEFDRSGGSPNQKVYDIEREGFHKADHIIAVSNFTKSKVVNHYGISPSKVDVVHNAVTFNDNKFSQDDLNKLDTDNVILFLGRVTLQKGPDYFLRAAKRVIDHLENDDLDVKFVFAGTGDMQNEMIRLAAELGISDKVLFAGWVTGPEIDKLYSMADLYVMPSVSEPFGITPLEAMRNGTPCLISNQSGVSEVVSHCLKVDFWDVDKMANLMMSVIKYSPLKLALQTNGSREIKKFNWDIPAKKCISVYVKVISEFNDKMLMEKTF